MLGANNSYYYVFKIDISPRIISGFLRRNCKLESELRNYKRSDTLPAEAVRVQQKHSNSICEANLARNLTSYLRTCIYFAKVIFRIISESAKTEEVGAYEFNKLNLTST